MVRQTRNIAAGKEDLATEEEKQQAYDYHNNTDSLYHEGINVGKEGFYDPNAGYAKHAEEPSDEEPKPILATDPGQPKGITANVSGRSSNSAVDKTEQRVISSGRKASKATAKDADGTRSEGSEGAS